MPRTEIEHDPVRPSDFVAEDGIVSLGALIARLHVTKGDLSAATGLPRDSLTKRARLAAPRTQQRLRDVVEILARVAPWAGSMPQAYAWYRAQPLPSFGGLTAEDLVKEGCAKAVKRHLSRIAEGGYA